MSSGEAVLPFVASAFLPQRVFQAKQKTLFGQLSQIGRLRWDPLSSYFIMNSLWPHSGCKAAYNLYVITLPEVFSRLLHPLRLELWSLTLETGLKRILTQLLDTRRRRLQLLNPLCLLSGLRSHVKSRMVSYFAQVFSVVSKHRAHQCRLTQLACPTLSCLFIKWCN